MKRLILAAVATLQVAAVAPSAVAQGMPPTLVETQPVEAKDFHNQITLVGRTQALSQSEIVAEVAGRVIAVAADEGIWVKRGDVLVRIDPNRIQYAYDAKRAEAAQAEAQALLAEKELARAKDLFAQKLISDGEMDTQTANATRAIEWHHQKQAEKNRLELDLRNCTIRAPFDGYTVRKLIDVGEWTNPGTPVFEMVDLSVIKVTVDLPERFFGHVARGSSVAISVSGDTREPVVGTVTGVAPAASEETHTFPVIVNVRNEDGRLGSGMLVRATLSLDEVFTSLAVSKDAIVRQGLQTMVYTIMDGKAVPIQVQTRSSEGQFVAVSGEGLAEGMPVVVRGNERIFPGSPVRTADGAGAAAPPGASGEAGADEGSGEGAEKESETGSSTGNEGAVQSG